MKKFVWFALLVLTTACSQSQVGNGSPVIEGYIIEADKREILVVSNISRKEAMALAREDIFNLNNSNAIVFSLPSDSDVYERGQRVQVWAEGGVRESFPAQAEAEKIILME